MSVSNKTYEGEDWALCEYMRGQLLNGMTGDGNGLMMHVMVAIDISLYLTESCSTNM